jgi:preprotein translocase subunit SecG
MQTVIVLIHLMVVVAMIGVVLLQRSEGGGLGIGGGGGGGFMSSRGTANVLTRTTAILAGAFFITSLTLSILAGLAHRPSSVIRTETPSAPSAPGAPSPLGSGGGVLDALRRGGSEAPQSAPAPSAPSGPEVPRSQ